MAIAALVVAVVSAFGALGAVWYARQSGRAADRSADASERSADAAERTTVLESGRRRGELTPRFSVSWSRDDQRLRLRVFLAGPPALEQLDGLALQIREFDQLQFVGLAIKLGWPPEDTFFGWVWAPYRFGGESQEGEG